MATQSNGSSPVILAFEVTSIKLVGFFSYSKKMRVRSKDIIDEKGQMVNQLAPILMLNVEKWLMI